MILYLNGVKTPLEIDTGASLIILNEKQIATIPDVQLERTETKLNTYIEESIEPVGKVNLSVEYDQKE